MQTQIKFTLLLLKINKRSINNFFKIQKSTITSLNSFHLFVFLPKLIFYKILIFNK